MEQVKVNIKQYMAMLSSFTECAQFKTECYRLKAENKKLRIELSNSLKVPQPFHNQVVYFDYGN